MTNSGWVQIAANQGGGLEYRAQPNAGDEQIAIRQIGDAFPRIILRADGNVFTGDGTIYPAHLNGDASVYTGPLDPSAPMGTNGDIYFKIPLGAGTPADSLWQKLLGTWVKAATFGSGGGGNVATDVIWDAKGDLAVGTGADTAVKLTVGANDTMPLADSTQTAGIKWGTPATVKTALSLANVDNTSDATKNAASVTLTNKTLTSPVINTGVSGTAVDADATFAANSDTILATQKAIKTALALKANLASPTFTGTVGGITATMVGLGSVTNDAQVKASIGTAKGSLVGFSASATPVEVAAGTNTYVLTADSTQTAGIKWAAAGGADGLGLTTTAVKTANYTAAAGDHVPCDATTAFTVTLPTAPADKSVYAVELVKTASSHNLTIALGGSDVFDVAGGATSMVLDGSLLFHTVIFQYNASGAIYYRVANYVRLASRGSLFTRNANGLSELAVGSANKVLRSDGTDPSWQAVTLTTDVTGTLPVGNGGVGAATLAAHGVVIGNAASAVSVTGAGSAGQMLTSNGASADPTYQQPPYVWQYDVGASPWSNSTGQNSLLASTKTFPTMAVGDQLVCEGAIDWLNNSGATQAFTFYVKNGSTTLASALTGTSGASANPHRVVWRAVFVCVAVGNSSGGTVMVTVSLFASTATVGAVFDTLTATNLALVGGTQVACATDGSGGALDFQFKMSTATATSTTTPRGLSAVYLPKLV